MCLCVFSCEDVSRAFSVVEKVITAFECDGNGEDSLLLGLDHPSHIY